MVELSRADRQRIETATREAEQHTSGEIVTVMAQRSDDYQFIPVLWATLAALFVPMPLIFLTSLPADLVYLVQLTVFAVLFVLLRWPALRLAVTPRSIKRQRAHRLAMEQFLAQNIHMTDQRTGVLIFLSMAERYIEIIADQGIYEKVDKQIWDKTVQAMSAHIRQGQIADGFVEAVSSCGQVLARHFPPGSSNVDELPNTIIEI